MLKVWNVSLIVGSFTLTLLVTSRCARVCFMPWFRWRRSGPGKACIARNRSPIPSTRRAGWPGRRGRREWRRRWATRAIRPRTSGGRSSGSATARSVRCVRCMRAWRGGPNRPLPAERPAETPPIPDGLSWDLWLGPAKARPYHPAYAPLAFHYWWDFGSGTLGNFGCHTPGHGRLGAGPERPGHGRGEFHPAQRGNHAARGDLSLRVSGPGRPATSRPVLVRWRFAPAPSCLPGTG